MDNKSFREQLVVYAMNTDKLDENVFLQYSVMINICCLMHRNS